MMHVACAADDAYAPHCAAMMASVLAHDDPATLAFHFLHPPDLPATSRSKLEAMVGAAGATIDFHAIPATAVASLPRMDRIPQVMWYRVLLPNLLPDVDRVLYLDADTLAADSLAPLWQIDLDGLYVGAVTNVFEPGMAGHARSLGLADPSAYFNSGVLMMNLAQMRADGVAAAVIEYARNRPLLWPDQDALNLVMSAHRASLHPRWNCMNALYYGREAREVFGDPAVREATASPAIVHFEGPQLAKPWHYLNRHPRRADYFAWRGHTPWPEVAIEGRTWKNRALRPLPVGVSTELLRLELRVRHRLAEVRP